MSIHTDSPDPVKTHQNTKYLSHTTARQGDGQMILVLETSKQWIFTDTVPTFFGERRDVRANRERERESFRICEIYSSQHNTLEYDRAGLDNKYLYCLRERKY